MREIHDDSRPDQWRYVPTKRNPADQGARGAFVQELTTDDCWCHGPSFLQGGEDEWPQRKFKKAPEAYEEVKSEKRGQFKRNEIIWFYQLSWQCKLATVIESLYGG